MVGKALCSLGYLMFRVFLETDNPYQEKIESAKAQSTIQILTADWICSPFAGKSPTMSPLFSDQKKASARYFHYPTTPSLHYSRSPLPFPVFLWWSAGGGCRLQEKACQEKSTRHACHHRLSRGERPWLQGLLENN